MVRLSRNLEAARRRQNTTDGCAVRGRNLHKRLGVNIWIYLGELEEVFTVVTRLGVVICRCRQPEVALSPESLRSLVGGMYAAGAGRRYVRGQYNDGSIHTHLNLQVALRAAVVGSRSWS